MKKLIITTAVMLVTAFGTQANAELALVTTSNGSFNFDPSGTGAGDNFNVGLGANSDDGLNDLAFFVGYRPFAGGGPDQIIQLTGPATQATNPASPIPFGPNNTSPNQGTFGFNPVSFTGSDGSNISVNADAFFRLTDAPGATAGDASANLLYELNLSSDDFTGANQGELLSFVGFDFNAGAASTSFATGTVPGFGAPANLQLANAASSRVLTFDGSFNAGTGNSNVVDADNAQFDSFGSNGLTTGLAARFDTVNDNAGGPGNLGLGAFSNFGVADDAGVSESTAGVFNFNSVSANAAIPEPSTLLMASMGLGMVAFRRRRRKQTA